MKLLTVFTVNTIITFVGEMMTKSQELKGHLEREDLTMEELVTSAHQLLAELAPKQSRYKVTERPDARTIRYYINSDLLPRPFSYEGGRARYSGTHLIRLLLIKKLQAEHYSLRKIASMLEGATDQEVLEELLYERSAPSLLVARPPESRPSKPPKADSASLERFRLLHGGSVDVPRDVLRDPLRRRELVESLEELSRHLRDSEDAAETD
jgi:DNA-binding transcriptional MerR regulator